MTIPGLKLIEHNALGIKIPDDLTFPFLLTVSLRPPEFMSFAFVALIGGNELIRVRGMTKETLMQFLDINRLRTHPRLISWEIAEK